MKKILVGLISILFFSCDVYDDRMTLCNKSSKKIFVTVSSRNSLEYAADMTIVAKDDKINYTRKLDINQCESIRQDGSNTWERMVGNKPSARLYFFVFSEKVIDENDWETIVEESLYNTSFSLTIEELNKLNWNVEIKSKQ